MTTPEGPTREVWRSAPGWWSGKRLLGPLVRQTRCFWFYRDEDGREQRASKFDHDVWLETLAPVIKMRP